MPRRVAVTGVGVVSPTGIGVEAFWEALMTARRGIGEIIAFDAHKFPCRIGAELADFSARGYVPKSYRKSVKVMARDIEIAVAAADLAFRDAGIVTRGIEEGKENVEAKRLGCNIGAGLICVDLDELGAAVNTALTDGRFDIRKWGSGGMSNLTPLWLLKYLPNMLSCHVTIIHGAEGPSNTITCCDASAHMAVGEATRMIARDAADVIVAGGAESKLNPMGLLRQGLLGRLCTEGNDRPADACRPFDAAHSGTVIGEGGGLLVLEDYDRAKQRGARIYAELIGFGAACDPAGMDITTATAGGLDLAAAKAIADAGIAPEQVDLIVAHGTAVPAEDQRECAAWQAALGSDATSKPAVSITGGTGSLYAGAGGAELATAALALHHQVIPPTVNFTAREDRCGLGMSDQPREHEINYVITGAFSIGGQSAACVLKRAEA